MRRFIIDRRRLCWWVISHWTSWCKVLWIHSCLSVRSSVNTSVTTFSRNLLVISEILLSDTNLETEKNDRSGSSMEILICLKWAERVSKRSFLKFLQNFVVIFTGSNIKWKNLTIPSLLVQINIWANSSSQFIGQTQPAVTCSKLTIETLEQSVKYVQMFLFLLKCSKLTIKTPERLKWCRRKYLHLILTYFTPSSSVTIVNFEQINAGGKISLNQWDYRVFWSSIYLAGMYRYTWFF